VVIEPMKAVLSDEPFSDPGWIFERKLDGIRCIAIGDRSGVSLMSRTARRMNDQFPEIAEALERDPADDFVLDGEVVAMRDGVSSFELLQQRHRRRVPVYYYVFDAPFLDGEDLRPVPLRERKARLRRALEFHGPIRFNPHRNGEHGEELFREACRKGLEGVIAKRADSPYTGKRSRDWLKLKCHAEQELVIGGFTAPKGSRTDFGALLVGYNENGALRYAGKVGTGFGHETLRELGARLRELEQDSSPFPPFKPIPPGTRWVRPELVAQIGFAEWTRDGRLRHPRFLGLRDDKPAREVVREVPS
jgi:bifunctional non-homologous end joining protein LigD